ncbi:MAG: DUF362 domain-containing protein [Bacteroidetes bacterium]|nr:DUF362 domain-containing protein [Bacteroidota bacterium]
MERKISRRKFITKTSKYTAAMAGLASMPGMAVSSIFEEDADIGIVNGTDYYSNTMRAIELIGGINKYVPQGSTVGLLINSDFEVEGAYVNPDIALATIQLINDAGADSITCIQKVKPEYWQRSAHFESHKKILDTLMQVETNTFPSEFNDTDFIKVKQVKGWKSLKETEVVKKWLECDVFINIAISKHHATTLMTGALKNIMGVSTRKANVNFHLGSGERNNPIYLAQCIVDQYMLKKTGLCIIDSTTFITDNGPSGPGTLKTLNKIVAGTDIVAIDALTSEYLDYLPEEITTTLKAHESGLGDMDYSKLNIVEINA